MTLEEAIKLEEEVAKDLLNVDESELDLIYCGDTECINAHVDRCIKYAEEHEQIAEWLKDYKRLKEQEPCEDCVSRQVVIEYIQKSDYALYNKIDNQEVVEGINALPSVTPTQKTGHWIVHPKGIYANLVCDKCLSRAPYNCEANYCPNCGAKMESEGK